MEYLTYATFIYPPLYMELDTVGGVAWSLCAFEINKGEHAENIKAMLTVFLHSENKFSTQSLLWAILYDIYCKNNIFLTFSTGLNTKLSSISKLIPTWQLNDKYH